MEGALLHARPAGLFYAAFASARRDRADEFCRLCFLKASTAKLDNAMSDMLQAKDSNT